MLLFLDTETTGLSRFQDHIVQVAWILCDRTGQVYSKQCHIVKPEGFSIPARVASIHGINDTIASKEGRPRAQVLTMLAKDAARASTVVAHNLQFDLGILEHDYDSAGLSFPFQNHLRICTMISTINWCRLPKLNGREGFKRPALAELHYKLFKHGFSGAHDAMIDTIACMNCYFELIQLGVISPSGKSNLISKSKNRLQKTNLPHISNKNSEDYETWRNNGANTTRTAEETRITATNKKQYIETENVKKKEAEAVEKSIRNNEIEIKNRYDDKLKSLTSSGNFLFWWLGCHTGVWILFENLSPRMNDGSHFIWSAICGAILAFFGRGWYEDYKKKSIAYQSCISQRDKEILAVRGVVPLSMTPSLVPVSSQIAQPLVSITKTDVTKGQSRRLYKNQLCDPMNVAGLKLILQSVPEYPGFAVVTGENTRSRNIVVYGSNVQLALKEFIEWVSKKVDDDWDEFLSLGFSPAMLWKVNSNPENVGKESLLAQAENTRLSRLLRSRLFSGMVDEKHNSKVNEFTQREGSEPPIKKVTDIVKPALIKKSFDARAAQVVHQTTNKHLQRTAEYQAERAMNKVETPPFTALGTGTRCTEFENTSEQLKKITAFVATRNKLSIEKLLTSTAPSIADRSVHSDNRLPVDTQNSARLNLGIPKCGYVPVMQAGKQGGLVTVNDLENYGSDLIYFFEQTAHRMYWIIQPKIGDVELLKSMIFPNFDDDAELFGGNLIDLAQRVAKQFLVDIEIGFIGDFEKCSYIGTDVINFGSDLVAVAKKVMSHAIAESFLSQAGVAKVSEIGTKYEIHQSDSSSELPPHVTDVEGMDDEVLTAEFVTSLFQEGTRVRHKKKGTELGLGTISNINDQYLTVWFPDRGKKFEMLTATATEYLSAID